MRIVLQRVSRASVDVAGNRVGEIGRGLLLLLGIEKADSNSDSADDMEDIDWLVRKVSGLRIFADTDDRMNLSLLDIGGEALVISQFTLHARTKKGNRPSFDQAAPPSEAIPRYEAFVAALGAALNKPVATGEFGATMEVSLVNDGPVTIVLDSRRRE